MDIKNSVVAVLNDKNKVIGTGFLAGGNLILTCAHVIEQATAGLNERGRMVATRSLPASDAQTATAFPP